jgi:hypothetical protein
LERVSRDWMSPDIFSPALAAYDEILTRSAVYFASMSIETISMEYLSFTPLAWSQWITYTICVVYCIVTG